MRLKLSSVTFEMNHNTGEYEQTSELVKEGSW